MNILTLNCGSSSLKCAVIDVSTEQLLASLRVERLNEAQPEIRWNEEPPVISPEPGYGPALVHALRYLKGKLRALPLHGIGHRVVHGGEIYTRPTLLDKQVLEQLSQMDELAPLHNPHNRLAIQMAMEEWPDLRQVAIFDTAFHATLPRRARLYALPEKLVQEVGIRKFGFHGTSHKYVARQAAQHMGFDLRDLRLITCHLGSGASVCAVEYGRSIETSMGMTPLEGLIMGTRSGDLDPGIVLHLQKEKGMSAEEVDRLLNQESGLKGLTGTTHMGEIEERASKGDEQARLAIQLFSHRLRKYIGAYAAVMGGVDAIVFTGGIGENSEVIRQRVAQRLEFLGAILDEDANRDVDQHKTPLPATISTANSRCQLLVVATNEELSIARSTAAIVQEKDKVQASLQIPIAISARHVHLTQEMVEKLFGEGYELTLKKWLSQPGQFAANETITLVGPKRSIEHVRILGPTRDLNQVEISRTDEFFLGIDAPVRASGHIENTPGIKIVGPKGSVTLNKGVICAWRHIHMTPEDALAFGVEDKDIVEVHIENGDRSLTFGNVLVRVSPKYKLEMHIDTDEGNAAEIGSGALGALLHTGKLASMVRKKT